MDNLPQDVRRRYLRSSYRICGRESILPQSMQIPLCCDLSETPQSCRRYADVWKGEHNGKAVAAKALRVYLSNDFLVIRKVRRPLFVMFVNKLTEFYAAIL